MNRIGLRRRLAARTGLSLRRSARALEATLHAVAEALARGERVRIRDLGTLGSRVSRAGDRTVRLMPSRPPRGPAAGKKKTTPPLGGAMDQKANQDERGGSENEAPRGKEPTPLGLDVGTSRIVLSRGAGSGAKTDKQ